MGKATIVSHLGAGKYRVLVDTERARADAEVARLNALIPKLQEELIPKAQDAITEDRKALKELQAKLDAALEDLKGGDPWEDDHLYEVGDRFFFGAPEQVATAATPGRSGPTVPDLADKDFVQEGVTWAGIAELGSGPTWSSDTWYDAGLPIRLVGADYSMRVSKSGYSGPTEPLWPAKPAPTIIHHPPDEAHPDGWDETIQTYPSLVEGLSWDIASATDAVLAAQEALLQARNHLDVDQLALTQLKARLFAATKKVVWLMANLPPVPYLLDLWCADLCDGKAAPVIPVGQVVGTIEPTGVPQGFTADPITHQKTGDPPVVRPGFIGHGMWGAGYVAAIDGKVDAAVDCTPWGQFVHLACLPGWAKWYPLYRKGTIKSMGAGGKATVSED